MLDDGIEHLHLVNCLNTYFNILLPQTSQKNAEISFFFCVFLRFQRDIKINYFLAFQKCLKSKVFGYSGLINSIGVSGLRSVLV